jgi:hypothetical protein
VALTFADFPGYFLSLCWQGSLFVLSSFFSVRAPALRVIPLAQAESVLLFITATLAR